MSQWCRRNYFNSYFYLSLCGEALKKPQMCVRVWVGV